MIKEFNIENKIIRIYCTNISKNQLPVIILNHFDDKTDNAFNECLNLNCKDFILVTISNIDWNSELTPYYVKKIFNNSSDYLGKADDYIKLLEHKIIPNVKIYIENELKIEIEYFGIVGYSLAGLFSIYVNYKSSLFTRTASVSGSLWYPNFINFIKGNKMFNNQEKIYFSLGNMESKTKNKYLKNVEENTKEIEKFYKDNNIKTIYEENEGNHFNNPDLRIGKAIKWILE